MIERCKRIDWCWSYSKCHLDWVFDPWVNCEQRLRDFNEEVGNNNRARKQSKVLRLGNHDYD